MIGVHLPTALTGSPPLGGGLLHYISAGGKPLLPTLEVPYGTLTTPIRLCRLHWRVLDWALSCASGLPWIESHLCPEFSLATPPSQLQFSRCNMRLLIVAHFIELL